MRPRDGTPPLLLGALALVGALLAATGCRSAAPAAETAGAAPSAPPWRVIDRSIEERPIECAVFGEGPVTVLVLASIHGDEAAGTPLVRELAARLHEAPDWLHGRRVIVVPEVNPDGVARGRRENARGVDLNRNFPARNWRAGRRYGAEPLSEPESRTVHDLVERYGVDRIVSCHQAADLLDYDGPARALAEAMTAVSPLRIGRLGARPGSLGSWAGVDRGIPTITIELRRADDRASGAELWERYGLMLVVAVRHAAS